MTIGTETFPETELSNEQYFEKLNHINSLSTTSQPSVGAFLDVYESLFSQGAEEMISLHLSSTISGTIRSAQMAINLAVQLQQAQIDVFDKVRSRSRAWQRVLDELTRAISSEKRFRICVMHVNIPKEGEELMEKLRSRFPEHEVRLFEAGAVIQLMSEQVHLAWLFNLGRDCELEIPAYLGFKDTMITLNLCLHDLLQELQRVIKIITPIHRTAK